VLAVLVGIFVALRRHVKSPMLNLWIAAWGLIFIHFITDWLTSADPNVSLMLVASEVSLQLSAIFFVASLTSFFENRKLTGALIILFAVPMVTYTTALFYDRDWRVLYIACSALLFFGLPLFVALLG